MAGCAHLDQIRIEPPESVEGCEDCLRTGDRWVHLRVCLTCGHVGCCDSSPNRHATKHMRASGHPIVRSAEPEEDWCWCYEDEVFFEVSKQRVATWIFEPGHTEAEFRARHMMVTWVRGLFKDIRGTVEFDREGCLTTRFEGRIDATRIWTGENDRDAHLRSADFFDVENHPAITFAGRFTERIGDSTFKGEAELTIRGVTATVPLDVAWLGEWSTPFWVGDENRGEMRRIGFEATTGLNRHDFGVSWQDELPGGGVVVSNWIEITIDVEAILREDLETTGAIGYYREIGALPETRS